jgi:hypothetical protein
VRRRCNSFKRLGDRSAAPAPGVLFEAIGGHVGGSRGFFCYLFECYDSLMVLTWRLLETGDFVVWSEG